MRLKLSFLIACVLASPVLSRADEPQPPKPGPEMDMLKKLAGDWDCTVSMMGSEEKASAAVKLGFGGFWLTEDFTGSFGGQKFEGRGTTGYDPIKKKYVTAWIDSMESSLLLMEGSFDKDGKTLTMTGEGVGMDAKPQKYKDVYEFPDKDTMVFNMYAVTDVKDQPVMKITYKRKK